MLLDKTVLHLLHLYQVTKLSYFVIKSNSKSKQSYKVVDDNNISIKPPKSITNAPGCSYSV